MPPLLSEDDNFQEFESTRSVNNLKYDHVEEEVIDLCSSDSTSAEAAESSEEEVVSNLRNSACRVRSTRGSLFHSSRFSTSPSTADEDDEGETDDMTTGQFINAIGGPKARPQKKRVLKSMRENQFVYPLSQYEGYNPTLPVTSEVEVIKEFENHILAKASYGDDKFTQFDLVNFSVYLPGTDVHHSWEMRGLQDLTTRPANSCYLFDGTLVIGKSRRYVQRIPFKLCSIGNYGTDCDSVGRNIWIQSEMTKTFNIHYRLECPSPEYARYHNGFLWLANLAKHFVDFCQTCVHDGTTVSIHNFRHDFARWLEDTHGKSPIFRNWYQDYNHPDFRRAISANINFLFKEAIGVSKELRGMLIWGEVMTMTAIPRQKLKETLTIVTPYVYDCFKHLKFGHLLKKEAPDNDTEVRRQSQVQSLHLTTTVESNIISNVRQKKVSTETLRRREDGAGNKPTNHRLQEHQNFGSIKVGDVLGVVKDGKGSLWKDEVSKWRTTDDIWYVYVQRIHVDEENVTSFHIIWLYKPADTTCALMKYPYSDELFLSDNCSCETSRILEDEVVCKVSVEWYGEPSHLNKDYFIRQTYLRDNSFVTLKEAHKTCEHLCSKVKPPSQDLNEKYKVGDTVLVVDPTKSKSKSRLEPVEILSFNQVDDKWFLTAKRLIRRRDFDGTRTARPNELVYSEEVFTVPARRVERGCSIRFYTAAQVERREVPPPYNRDGTGDCYYIVTRVFYQDGVAKLLQIGPDDTPSSLRQGFDPDVSPLQNVLRGFDWFSGNGNFARGLEEGGAVQTYWAVDWDENAMHSNSVNRKDPKATKFFLGSVDDFMSQAIKGNPDKSPLIPAPGEVDFLSAGNPCPGYSLLNSKRDSASGLKNQSLIADVASFIDFYRPRYALLENVVTMAQKGRNRDEDILSQFICCIVGMGYQLQLFNLDAWSFGSPQSRSRLFVSIAAPGLSLPNHPAFTHSHPVKTKQRGLGKMSNDLAFGNRQFPKYTPFEFVTAGEATEDLPDIGDGNTNHCTLHPDHRMSKIVKRDLKAQMDTIPMLPPGMNFAKAWAKGKGHMTQAERDLFPFKTKKGGERHNVLPDSRAWGRVNPQELFSTIVTSIEPTCARTGRVLHWDQPRLLSLMEARRAQSFPDEEVLVGIPSAQYKIVGNSVARSVSMALGLSLREAWLKDSPEKRANPAITSKTETSMCRSRISSKVAAKPRFKVAVEEARHWAKDTDAIELSSEEAKSPGLNQINNLKDQEPSAIQEDESSLPSSKFSTDQESSNSRKRRFNLAGHDSTAPSKKKILCMPTRLQQTLQQQRPKPKSRNNTEAYVQVLIPHNERLADPTVKRPALEPTLLMQKLQAVKDERDIYEVECINLKLHRDLGLRSTTPNVESLERKKGLPIHTKPTKTDRTKHQKFVNLVSDEEDDGGDEDEGDDEDIEIVSVKKKCSPYVNVDNSMSEPYAQTFSRMRKPSPKRRKR